MNVRPTMIMQKNSCTTEKDNRRADCEAQNQNKLKECIALKTQKCNKRKDSGRFGMSNKLIRGHRLNLGGTWEWPGGEMPEPTFSVQSDSCKEALAMGHPCDDYMEDIDYYVENITGIIPEIPQEAIDNWRQNHSAPPPEVWGMVEAGDIPDFIGPVGCFHCDRFKDGGNEHLACMYLKEEHSPQSRREWRRFRRATAGAEEPTVEPTPAPTAPTPPPSVPTLNASNFSGFAAGYADGFADGQQYLQEER